MTAQEGVYLIAPCLFHNLFNPVEKVGLLVNEAAVDIGKANGLKDPKHSSGGPAITGRPKVIVLVGTELDVLPQLC